MGFEPVMQGLVWQTQIATVAAMRWPAPMSLTASSLNSSVYRARFVFPIPPPMKKTMHLVMGSTFRGQGQFDYSNTSLVTGVYIFTSILTLRPIIIS